MSFRNTRIQEIINSIRNKELSCLTKYLKIVFSLERENLGKSVKTFKNNMTQDRPIKIVNILLQRVHFKSSGARAHRSRKGFFYYGGFE